MTWGSFNWKMNFRWTHVPERENVRRNYDKTLPLRCAPSPTLLLSPARLSTPIHSPALCLCLCFSPPALSRAAARQWIGLDVEKRFFLFLILYSFLYSSSRLLSFFMFRLRLLDALPLSFHFLCFLLRRLQRLCLIASVTPYRIASPLPERFDASSLLFSALYCFGIPCPSPLLSSSAIVSPLLASPVLFISSARDTSPPFIHSQNRLSVRSIAYYTIRARPVR